MVAVPNFNTTIIDEFGGLMRSVIIDQVLWPDGKERAGSSRQDSSGDKADDKVASSRRTSMNDVKSLHGAFIESCYHHCGYWGMIAIDGHTAGVAHQMWLQKERFIFEQIEMFPCHDCCTILHVSHQPPPSVPLASQSSHNKGYRNPWLNAIIGR